MPNLSAPASAARCRAVAGDFFQAVPAGGDTYVLSQVLHDWEEECSLANLKQCRQVMPRQAKLLVIELVLPAGNEPFIGKWLDLHMLGLAGGREQAAAEYEELFRAGRFAVTRVAPTELGPSVVEAVPV